MVTIATGLWYLLRCSVLHLLCKFDINLFKNNLIMAYFFLFLTVFFTAVVLKINGHCPSSNLTFRLLLCAIWPNFIKNRMIRSPIIVSTDKVIHTQTHTHIHTDTHTFTHTHTHIDRRTVKSDRNTPSLFMKGWNK